MPALALTDKGRLTGSIEFYETCRKEGVQADFRAGGAGLSTRQAGKTSRKSGFAGNGFKRLE